MSERQTISDSKKAFHKAFPYVIPPIYRRITDELLVELHLLSHQKDFKPDPIFAIGLINAFETFTRGYRPEKHLKLLFDALCKSNGFDPVFIRTETKRTLESIKGTTINEITNFVKSKGTNISDEEKEKFEWLSKVRIHYSRILVIGLLTLLEGAKHEGIADKSSINDLVKDIIESYGFSKERVNRDLNLYTSNIEKMSQAIELMKESVARERKKKE